MVDSDSGNSRVMSGFSLSDSEFQSIRSFVYDKFGINLTEEKRGLVLSRLQKVLRQRGFSDFSSYFDFVKSDKSGQAVSEMINRISTNHTFFFREQEHFDFFKQTFLPDISRELEAKRSCDLRIWSAGCSSGEEPYTLIILLLEFFGMRYSNWQAGVLATDISANVLEHAQRGIYTGDRLTKTPPEFVRKYFDQISPEQWQVKEKLRREVTFRRFNLMSERFPFKRPFHCIFCRNVMIYFDNETRKKLVKKYYDMLEPGGYLFIGHSESLGRDNGLFQYVMPALYRKEA